MINIYGNQSGDLEQERPKIVGKARMGDNMLIMHRRQGCWGGADR